MTTTAKRIRLGRFLDRGTRHGLIVPIDHGLTLGPIDGIGSSARIAAWLDVDAGVNGVVLHKGLLERLAARGALQGMGVMLHLNGMPACAAAPDTKAMVTEVQTAVRLGADAVSVQLNFDGANDAHNVALLGAVADAAAPLGLPVLTMLYDKKPGTAADARVARLRHLMRTCIELGTDALKIGAPEQLADVPAILRDLADDALIFFAGGAVGSEQPLVELTTLALRHGGAGLCVGRNVFQRPDPRVALRALKNAMRPATVNGHDARPAAEVRYVGLH
jgi:class I fructose-bisphosphate aldolase/fructose-bisphosphate aldolase/2-amino-3,7-dideoxy-D-threo-hept-6-ulosonate synthase